MTSNKSFQKLSLHDLSLQDQSSARKFTDQWFTVTSKRQILFSMIPKSSSNIQDFLSPSSPTAFTTGKDTEVLRRFSHFELSLNQCLLNDRPEFSGK